MAVMVSTIWPLAGLEVRTPSVTLRYVTDDLGFALAELAAQGVHDRATMPFTRPWTDVAAPELQRNTLRYYWRSRAETTVDHWDLHFAVLVSGVVVGMCSIASDRFPVLRSAETGSWIGRAYQGRGIGREVRQAALHMIFRGLDADHATTGAWHDNVASLAVTRSLPYLQTGTSVQPRRGSPDRMLHFAISRADWQRVARDDIELVGIDAVRAQLETRRNVRGASST
ncbi:GNAT family N-acetyltransferase [Mycobacterium sp. G7A2]|uniref:GNAT family N-acetyltransferase n=1 Tax=Mycobacterium sp. G7A2 TaxID=3317307 RepID=UPI0035A82D7E